MAHRRSAPAGAGCTAPGICLLVLLAATGPAAAGGLYVPGNGASALGRAGAVVARADDPSALYYNPAGFAVHEGTLLHIGVNFLAYSLIFQREGVYEPVGDNTRLPYQGQPYAEVRDASRPTIGIGPLQAIPLIALSTDLGVPRRWRFGFGIFAPHGFPDRDFTADYVFEAPGQPPPPQRYDVMNQQAIIALPSVALAYSPTERLHLGLRLSWGVGEVRGSAYTWGFRNFEEWVARDAMFDIATRDYFIPAFGLGLLYRPTGNLELGASYSSAVQYRGKGTATILLGSDLGLNGIQDVLEPVLDRPRCDGGGTVVALKMCLDLDLAQWAAVGVRWVARRGASERADLELDLVWENWASASDFDLVVDGRSSLTGRYLEPAVLRHQLRDVLSVRTGGSYTVPVAPRRALVLRAGVAHDTAAADLGWTRLDVDSAARTTVTAGLTVKLGTTALDLGVGGVFEPARTVEACNPSVERRGCADGRDGPSPIQPLQPASTQEISPFNGGTYTSGYFLASIGLTVAL